MFQILPFGTMFALRFWWTTVSHCLPVPSLILQPRWSYPRSWRHPSDTPQSPVWRLQFRDQTISPGNKHLHQLDCCYCAGWGVMDSGVLYYGPVVLGLFCPVDPSRLLQEWRCSCHLATWPCSAWPNDHHRLMVASHSITWSIVVFLYFFIVRYCLFFFFLVSFNDKCWFDECGIHLFCLCFALFLRKNRFFIVEILIQKLCMFLSFICIILSCFLQKLAQQHITMPLFSHSLQRCFNSIKYLSLVIVQNCVPMFQSSLLWLLEMLKCFHY